MLQFFVLTGPEIQQSASDGRLRDDLAPRINSTDKLELIEGVFDTLCAVGTLTLMDLRYSRPHEPFLERYQ
jgi:hypothetical protein